jgi:hypothetical protein
MVLRPSEPTSRLRVEHRSDRTRRYANRTYRALRSSSTERRCRRASRRAQVGAAAPAQCHIPLNPTIALPSPKRRLRDAPDAPIRAGHAAISDRESAPSLWVSAIPVDARTGFALVRWARPSTCLGRLASVLERRERHGPASGGLLSSDADAPSGARQTAMADRESAPLWAHSDGNQPCSTSPAIAQ